MDGTHLVVCKHDRHEDRVFANSGRECQRIDSSLGVDFQIGHFEPFALQSLAAIEDRSVLRALRNDVATALSESCGHALDGEIVAFGGAGGEDHLVGLGADEICNGRPCSVHGLPCTGAVRVAAACRVPVVFLEKRQHGVDHPPVCWGRRVVIHVDQRVHHGPILALPPPKTSARVEPCPMS